MTVMQNIVTPKRACFLLVIFLHDHDPAESPP